jgi:hypothetical protein
MPIQFSNFKAIRGALRQIVLGTEQEALVTPGGETIYANGLPLGAELGRQGRSFWAILATPVAPVVAIPTTASLFGLWNGEPDGGKTYAVDTVGVISVVLTAASQIATPIVNLSSVKPAAQAVSAVLPKSLRTGQTSVQTRAAIVLNGTLAVATDNWFPPPGLGSTGGLAIASTFGQVNAFDVQGKVQVTPGHIMNVNAMATAATASSILIYVAWHELLLDVTG